MRRILPTLALVMLAGATLAGCTAEPPIPDNAEVQAWAAEAQQRSADAPDALAMAAGATGPEATNQEATAEGAGTIIDFAEPVHVDNVVLTCFGEGTVTIALTVTSATKTMSLGDNVVSCADGDHVVDFSGSNIGPATKLEVNDVGASQIGYWSATAHGTRATAAPAG